MGLKWMLQKSCRASVPMQMQSEWWWWAFLCIGQLTPSVGLEATAILRLHGGKLALAADSS